MVTKKEFTEDTLQTIALWGSVGYPLREVAGKLGMTLDELRRCRWKNSKLDDALKRYEYNMEAYLVSEYSQKLMSDLPTKEKAVFLGVISAEMYVYLSEKIGLR